MGSIEILKINENSPQFPSNTRICEPNPQYLPSKSQLRVYFLTISQHHITTMAPVSCARQAIVLTLFFTSGALNAVLTNAMYNTKAIGLHNRLIPFKKPWFQGWVMFFGMSCLIFDTPCLKKCKCQPYVIGGTVRGWGLFRNVAIPGLCDLFATVLQNIAFLYLAPSVWQMFRGSILLFTALFAICYRKKKLKCQDWLGVLVTMVGITVVGLSSILRKSDGTESTVNSSTVMKVVSMGLIILAQGLQAFQTIVEEELLHDVDATESEIVAFEGLWGLYFSTFLTMPLANILPQSLGEGLFEQSIETFVMLGHSWKLGLLVLFYCISIVCYNQTGMMVTSFSTAIHRNIYEALRSIAVWALSAIVYYIWPNSGCGEKLELLSLVQCLGFLISILGSFIYNRVIKFPCFDYSDEEHPTKSLNDDPLLE